MGAPARLSPNWSVELPGTQLLGAAVGAASLVVSTFDGVHAGRDAAVVALDLRTGAEHWIDRAGRRTTAAVVVAGRLAVSVDRTANVTARSIETGRVEWARKLRTRVTETPTWALAAGGGHVYLGGAPVGLVALDTATGATTWVSEPLFLELQHPSVALARGRLLVVDTQQIVSVEAVSHRTSSWVWGRGEQFGFNERPVVHGVLGGLVVASTGFTLLAVDVFGVIRWSHTFEGRVAAAAPTASGIVAVIERVYDAQGELLWSPDAVGPRLSPVLIGLDLAGDQRWERELDGHSEVIADGHRVLLLEGGRLSGVDPATGGTTVGAAAHGLDGLLLVVPERRRLLGAGRHGTQVTSWDLTELESGGAL